MRSNKARARAEQGEPSGYAFRVMSGFFRTSSIEIDLRIHRGSLAGYSPYLCHRKQRVVFGRYVTAGNRSFELVAQAAGTREDVPLSSSPPISERFSSGDRRASLRFPIVIGLKYRAFRKHLVVGAGVGQTINIASRGVLFRAETALENGSFVELSLEWPVLHQMRGRLQLRAHGTVVRVEGNLAGVQLIKPELV